MALNLFNRGNQYADDGELLTAAAQDIGGKYKTQVVSTGQVVGANTTTLYTVPAGNVFFMSSFMFTHTGNVANSIAFYLKKNAAGAFTTLFRSLKPTVPNAETKVWGTNLTMPLRFVAGDTIDIQCDNANGVMVGSISGWLENA